MATNWRIDNFCIVQEDGGNILTEADFYLAQAEYNATEWTIDTSSGDG